MVDKLSRVLSQVFDIPAERITDEDAPDTIQSWDSLTHVHLVLALEAEFALVLSPDDAAEMLSVGAIRQILTDKGVTSWHAGVRQE
jgi:acyl carrier protein